MNDTNCMEATGNLGRDPELRTFDGGNSVCNCSIASSQKWKDKATGEERERTVWLRVVVWGWLADVIAKARKGQKLFVRGELQCREYEHDGQQRESWEIHVGQMPGSVAWILNTDVLRKDGGGSKRGFGGSGGSGRSGGFGGGQQRQPAPPPQQDEPFPDEEDIPF